MAETHQNFVGGEWIDAGTGETFEVRNPADTAEVVGHFQRSGPAEADAAVEAAAGAQAAWAERPGPERGEVLKRTAANLAERKEELAETLTREEGKTLAEARPEVQRAVDIFYYYAEKARDYRGEVKASSSRNERLFTLREPMGVAALITPWNYPIAIPAWKIAPALATGNAVVIKPATQAPGPAHAIARALDDAGLPDGVLNLVVGSGSEVGATINEHDLLYLEAPIKRVTGFDTIMPLPKLEDAYLPDAERIQNAIDYVSTF